MDTYALLFVFLGVAILAAAVLPSLIATLPISLPILYVGVGMGLFSLPFGLEAPQPDAEAAYVERLTEFVVIVSLMGAGLKLRRRVGWRTWSST